MHADEELCILAQKPESWQMSIFITTNSDTVFLHMHKAFLNLEICNTNSFLCRSKLNMKNALRNQSLSTASLLIKSDNKR